MIRTPEGLRWSCLGCADCCSSGFDLGPVEDEIIKGLHDQRIEALWAPAGEGPWHHTRPGPKGEPLTYLTQRAGRCIFLRPDNLCAVHALLGPQAKPGFCREFPYHLVQEPRGWVAIVRPTCGGLHRSFKSGEPPDPAAALALTRVHARRRFAPTQIELLPGHTLELAEWLSLEDTLLQSLPAPGPPEATIAWTRRALYQHAQAEAPTVRPEQGVAAASAIFMALGQILDRVLAQPGGPPDRVAFAEHMHRQLARARSAIEAPLPPLSPEAREYTDLLIRSHLLAKQWEAWGSVHAGLGHLLLGTVYARALAPQGPVSTETFAEHYREWLRFAANTMIQHLLRRAQVALTDLFLHAR